MVFNFLLILFFFYLNPINSFERARFSHSIRLIMSDKMHNRKYPFFKQNYQKANINKEYIENASNNDSKVDNSYMFKGRYPLSRRYFESYVKRLNSKNITIQSMEILKGQRFEDDDEDEENKTSIYDEFNSSPFLRMTNGTNNRGGFRIVINGGLFNPFEQDHDNEENGNDDEDMKYGRSYSKNKDKKSKNFEVVTKYPIKFKDVGGYSKVKEELSQCIDILSNYTKYKNFNVRVPKGLILEGPPGNGKTLLAKALAGEANVGFIPVSGAEFQDKYVGVGSSKVRELFELAKKNAPCIIFIDEIDAIGRKRSGDGESSSNERDSTLNELLVALDGFKNNTGIFLVGATNRIDLLDSALIRPGRIDKKIYIGHPDSVTREAIINIHLNGKPNDNSIIIKDLVDITLGLSGAQIENLLNEAMLNALRKDNYVMTNADIDEILNRIMAGWQPTDHQFTSDIIDHIAIHEMGHAIVGILSKHHSKMTKVIINLSSPKSPAYTVFEGSTSSIYTREALFEHLAILLAGRIAEEAFYDVSVTTGAINDFEEAFKLAEKMIVYYGFGKKLIYPNQSEKYKELIDNDVAGLINDAYSYAEFIINNSKDLISECADILKREKILKSETLIDIIDRKYHNIYKLRHKKE